LSTLERMQRDLQTLHGKMIQAAKRRDETLRRQFMHARALAFPGGHAQERTIGFVSFLNEYGPALVDRLDEELPLDLGHHWIDDLDGSAVRRRARFARTFRVTATGSPEGLRYRDSRASPSFRVASCATGGRGAI